MAGRNYPKTQASRPRKHQVALLFWPVSILSTLKGGFAYNMNVIRAVDVDIILNERKWQPWRPGSSLLSVCNK